MEDNPTAPAEAPAPESVWVKIPLTDGLYEVSSSGGVARMLKHGNRRILKPYHNNTPYLSVKIFDKNGKMYNKYVHRLVAEAFLPHVDGELEVNHKNGDKTDNRINNLEWVTHSENNLHKFRVLKTGWPSAEPVQVAICGTRKVYESIAEASREIGVSTTTIRRHLNGQTKSIKGIKLIRKEIF